MDCTVKRLWGDTYIESAPFLSVGFWYLCVLFAKEEMELVSDKLRIFALYISNDSDWKWW